jgi:hypothetical protein
MYLHLWSREEDGPQESALAPTDDLLASARCRCGGLAHRLVMSSANLMGARVIRAVWLGKRWSQVVGV